MSSAPELHPVEGDLHAYQGYQLIAVAIAFIVLSTVAVCARLYARRMQRQALGLDDYFVISALIFTLTLCGLGIAMPGIAGVGQHITVVLMKNKATMVTFAKALMAWEILYGFAVALSKCAILLFYLRVFTVRIRLFTNLIYVVAFVTIGNGLATILVAAFQCSPVAYDWNKTIRGGKCINQLDFYRWISVPNVITDFVMLLLPLPMVWRLHTTLAQKIALTTLFGLGSLGFIASCVRMSIFFQTNALQDATWNAVPLCIWTIVEPAMIVVAGCLPSLRPIFIHLFPHSIVSSIGKSYESKEGKRQAAPKGSWSNSKTSSGKQNSGFSRMDDSSRSWNVSNTVSSSKDQQIWSDPESEAVPLNAIRVKHDHHLYTETIDGPRTEV